MANSVDPEIWSLHCQVRTPVQIFRSNVNYQHILYFETKNILFAEIYGQYINS